MKFFRILLALLASSLFIISSCQKELYFDDVSSGTLSDSSGDCHPSIVNGIYRADSVLGSGNYIDVQVNANIPGSYLVLSDTVNGYYFRGEGTLGSSGLNTVRIYGSGKPLAAGTNTFFIQYGTSFCALDVTVLPGNASTSADFTLGGAPGNCTGATINGSYMSSVPMTNANTVLIDVNVTTTGNYNISSTTVNGGTFTGSGVFSTTGPQTVTLIGSGTPAAQGTFDYPVTANGSTCSFSIIYTPAATPAIFTLNGDPGTCTGATANGTYATGIALGSGNTVSINVNVTSIGAYSITTGTVNGISFSNSGNLNVTGPQTVTLLGSGTPLAPGAYNYTANGNPGSCDFSVTAITTTVNNDYFPLTLNSWWTYDSDNSAPDSLYKTVSGNFSAGGNSYQVVDIGVGALGSGTLAGALYRKAGNDYYQFVGVDSFSVETMETYQMGDLLFMKENAPVGTTWESTEFIGAQSGTSLSLKLKYSFAITAAGTSRTVNGKTYNNVTTVTWSSLSNIDNAGYTTDLDFESYYAKGVGLIEFRAKPAGSTTWPFIETLRNYLVF